MRSAWHVTLPLLALAMVLTVALGPARAEEDDLADVLKNATTTSAPAGDPQPELPKDQDPLGTRKEKAPEGSRLGAVTLNDGTKLEGRVWTTADKPLRVWVESAKMYRDIDLLLIRRIEVVVQEEKLEDDWRWLKEGSDQKVYSGKKYPNVSLAYRFTLLNEQITEGTMNPPVPLYLADQVKRYNLVLYAKHKGKLGETLKDVVYVKTVTLRETPDVTAANEKKTTKLPLLD